MNGHVTGSQNMASSYPKARRDTNVVEVLHNVKIIDHYRWLENPDSDETMQFVDAQNSLSEPYIRQYPDMEKIRTKLKSMFDYPKINCPFHRGNKYFYFYNSGLQNQRVLYIQDDLNSEGRIFLDPNEFSDDGTVALTHTSFSEDGKTVAYSLSTSGSDWSKIYFRSVETGQDYDDVLEKVKFSSATWTHDNLGVFYGRFNQQGVTDGSETTSNLNQKLYYHRLNTHQSEDVLCVEFVDHPKWRIATDISECGRYLVLTLSEGCKDKMVYVSDLSLIDKSVGFRGLLNSVCVVDKFEADYEFITNIGPKLVMRTNKNAPNYCLVTVDLNVLAGGDKTTAWQVLVPENQLDVLDLVTCVHDKYLIICYLRHVKHILHIHSLESGEFLQRLDVPLGTVSCYTGRKRDQHFFYKLTSFLTPGIIYKCDLNVTPFQSEVYKEIKVPGFNADNFECKQIFYKSHDDVSIPMFIMHRRGISLDGTSPCLLYGYGGFNISLQPTFSITKLLFAQNLGGVFALPNIRGGGEYGEKWHNSGRLLNKQNCFKDFARAAEYLIDNGYTSAAKLCSEGGSNGGLLVMATANMRPELFGSVVAHVGVMDMLRFHKFTIGYAWMSDYGNPEEEKHFRNLYQFSPLHNIRPPPAGVQYPATLLLTADHDDRVVPLHTLKFIAQLQHVVGNSQTQVNPLLVRVDTKSGHGAGKPTMKMIDEMVEVFSFISQTFGLRFSD